jgi:putative FmdB family regulatory protein
VPNRYFLNKRGHPGEPAESLREEDEGIAMPTYEYACTKCGEHLEAVQSFTDDPLKKCPACGGRLKKVFGNVGIVF